MDTAQSLSLSELVLSTNLVGNCLLHQVLCVVVMEYIPCGELFALWKKLHNFSDLLVRLYVAELGMVLGQRNFRFCDDFCMSFH